MLCTIWGKIAETTVKYCGKGSLVGITGRLNTRSYEKEEGLRVLCHRSGCGGYTFFATKKRDEEQNLQTQPNNKEESDFEFPMINQINFQYNVLQTA